jgi:DNA-binding transcriptional MerR regulator
MSGPQDDSRRPKSWDRQVSAAYLRLLGATQSEAAKGVGCSSRTIRRWEREVLWLEAVQEAKRRWLSGVENAARVALLRALQEPDAGLFALRVLERLDPRLAPPGKQPRHQRLLEEKRQAESLARPKGQSVAGTVDKESTSLLDGERQDWDAAIDRFLDRVKRQVKHRNDPRASCREAAEDPSG